MCDFIPDARDERTLRVRILGQVLGRRGRTTLSPRRACSVYQGRAVASSTPNSGGRIPGRE